MLFAKSSVWKISSAKNSFYLGGTCHVLAKSDYPLPIEFDRAYSDSEVLVFETDIKKMEDPQAGLLLMSKAVYHDGRSLKSVLTDTVYGDLQNYFNHRVCQWRCLRK